MIEIIKNHVFISVGQHNYNLLNIINDNYGYYYTKEDLSYKKYKKNDNDFKNTQNKKFLLYSHIDYVLYQTNSFNTQSYNKMNNYIKYLNNNIKYININCFYKQCFIDIYNKQFYYDLQKLILKYNCLFKLQNINSLIKLMYHNSKFCLKLKMYKNLYVFIILNKNINDLQNDINKQIKNLKNLQNMHKHYI